MTKFIFITGGVVSSLGKGISAASIGQLLKLSGFKIFMQKFDPYINVNTGRMSPDQHGEVFVTQDGGETDLDLGHYERFIDENLLKESSISTGQIYKSVIFKEEKGLYDGKTVQIIPHITDEIKEKLLIAAKKSKADIIIVEIGGTVGDIESLPFLDAIRQFRSDIGHNNTIYIHNTLVPYLNSSNEIKTKPTQHSVKELKALGINPDFLILRSDSQIEESAIKKISDFSNISVDKIINLPNFEILYEVIPALKVKKIDEKILEHFQLKPRKKIDLTNWQDLIFKIKNLKEVFKVGIIGKYDNFHDAYLSIIEALKHAGYYCEKKIDIKIINPQTLDKLDDLNEFDGIIIADEFNLNIIDKMISIIKYLRINNISTLGISQGMNLMLIEYGRNVLKLKEDIIIKKNQFKIGAFEIDIRRKSKLEKYLNQNLIRKRMRYEFEFDLKYAKIFEKNADITFSAKLKDNTIVAFEHNLNNYFIGVLFHLEFSSRPLRANSLLINFINSRKLNKEN